MYTFTPSCYSLWSKAIAFVITLALSHQSSGITYENLNNQAPFETGKINKNTGIDKHQLSYAVYTELGKDVFVLALSNTIEEARFEIKILQERLPYRRLVKLLRNNAAVNNPTSSLQRNSAAFEQLSRYSGLDLEKGDHLIFQETTKGMILSMNGLALNVFESPEIFRLLHQVWIGDIPPSREFKNALLSEKNLESENLFNTTSASADRINTLSAWLETDTLKHEEQEKQLALETAQENTNLSTEEKIIKDNATQKINPVSPPISASKTATSLQRIPDVRVSQQKKIKHQSIDKSKKMKEPSEQIATMVAQYAAALATHAHKNIVYPLRAQAKKQTGNVLATVTINRDGELLNLVLDTKSDHLSLNKAAERGIKDAQPFPSIPQQIEGDSFTFEVPVAFLLRS